MKLVYKGETFGGRGKWEELEQLLRRSGKTPIMCLCEYRPSFTATNTVYFHLKIEMYCRLWHNQERLAG